MYLVLVDQPGADTWPIAGASFILVQKDQADAARAKTHAELLRLGLQERRRDRPRASTTCRSPTNVYELVESDVWSNVTVGGTAVWQ